MINRASSAWSLTGKRALITGGTKGIGLATAQVLIERGAEVCILARTDADIEKTVSRLRETGQAIGFPVDLSQPDAIQQVTRHLSKAWPVLDILVNNTGMNIRKAFIDYSQPEFETLFQTNLMSALRLTQALYPQLKASGRASVVNIASVAGSLDVKSGPPYGMTKAALLQMTRHLAVEWAKDRIRVNSVSPWYTRTPLIEPILQNADRMAMILNRTPAGRIAEPEEIANVVAFLCMDEAGYVTGQEIKVDGGLSANGL